MENKLIATIMVAVVGIILVGSLLVPTIDSTTTKHDNFTNGQDYMEYNTEDAVLVLTPTGVTMDGDELTQTSSGYVYFYSEKMLAYGWSESEIRFVVVGSARIDITDTDEYTVTISNGSAVINDGTNDILTVDCEGFYTHTTEATDKVMKTPGSGVYLNNVSEITTTIVPNAYATYYLNDGILYFNGDALEYTVSSGYSAVSGYNDLYLTSGAIVLHTEEYGDVNLNNPYLCDTVVVGTGDGAISDSAAVSLLYVIPVLILIGIIMAAIALFRKED